MKSPEIYPVSDLEGDLEAPPLEAGVYNALAQEDPQATPHLPTSPVPQWYAHEYASFGRHPLSFQVLLWFAVAFILLLIAGFVIAVGTTTLVLITTSTGRTLHDPAPDGCSYGSGVPFMNKYDIPCVKLYYAQNPLPGRTSDDAYTLWINAMMHVERAGREWSLRMCEANNGTVTNYVREETFQHLVESGDPIVAAIGDTFLPAMYFAVQNRYCMSP